MQTVTMKHRLRFDDLETIVAAVRAGAGLARLPCWLVAEDVRSGALERVLPATPGPKIDVHLAWRRTRHLPSRVRVAIDLLMARLPLVVAGSAAPIVEPSRA
jgi:DNA-binding transcriptional LysR family regulator